MDISLYYSDKGESRPILLLHGNGEDSGYFKNQTEHFSGRYRVISVDTRGHGRSPRGTAPFTIEQFAEDLKCLMAGLVIAGTRDMVKRSHTELIAKSIPGARLSIIEGDHFIACKEPERFNREVDGFLEEIGGK